MKTLLIPVTVQTNKDDSLNFRDGKARKDLRDANCVPNVMKEDMQNPGSHLLILCFDFYTLLSFNISRLWQRNIFMFTSGAYLMTSHQKMKLLWLS